jgi:hypothetical protein
MDYRREYPEQLDPGRMQRMMEERAKLDTLLSMAESSLNSGQDQKAIAYALIFIARRLDSMAGSLSTLVGIQRRIADAEAPPPDPYSGMR